MSTEQGFWTRLTHWRFVMNLKAPEGQEARVTVRLNDGGSFEPSVVSFDPPWLVFRTFDAQRHTRVIAVQEAGISSVEIALGRKDEETPGGLAVRPNLDDFLEEVPEA